MIDEVSTRNLMVESFLARVDTELKRAERYRFFVSLIVLDLSFTRPIFGQSSFQVVSDLLETVQTNIRIIDDVSLMGEHSVVLLLPETSRQGAEIAAKRVSELIRNNLVARVERRIEQMIPLEIVSYPDAAGAKTVNDFVRELTRQNSN
jgi:GGDEF domain-containing protein